VQKKPKIHDLSRSPSTDDEMRAVWSALAKEEHAISPIVAAILGMACVEYRVEKLLRKRFLRNNDDEWAALTGDDGPLGTFSKKVLCGYAFKICDQNIYKQMNYIRVIRNQFAHAKRIITFKNKLIIDELRKASIATSTKRNAGGYKGI
jgi:hypothetical protein